MKTMTSEPRVGLEFTHARVLDENYRPMRYRVTKIRHGMVYYRPVDGGGPDCCPVEDFPRYAREDA